MQTVRVDISDLDVDGDGLARLGGREVRIPGVVPGEQVEVRLVRARRGAPSVELSRVLRASPHRVAPRCRHAGVCGGCSWQHIAYDEQLRLKRRMLARLLVDSLGEAAPEVAASVRAVDPAAPWGFRSKVSFVFGPGPRGQSLVMGHYQRGSKRIVPALECPVHAEAGNDTAFSIRDALMSAGVSGASEDGQRGVVRHLVVRIAHNGRERLATLVVTSNDTSLRGAVRRALGGAGAPDGLHLNIHDRPGPFLFGPLTRKLHGRDRLREEVGGVSFLVSPTAFFQTNIRAAEILVGLVVEAACDRPARCVLDLYAGAGLFALPLARRGHQVTAVEENPEAIEDGCASLRFSQIPPRACRFVRGRVEEVIGRRGGGAASGPPPEIVVLDPPRSGCSDRVMRTLTTEIRPERMIYVSCNPAALARDLARVRAGGYRIDRIQPVDMFPHTAHIESVTLLTRAQRGTTD